MKTVLKLVIAVALLNAVVRGADSLWNYYQLKDAAERALLFGSQRTSQQVHQQIMERALELDVPLKPEDNYSITYYAPQPRAVLRVVDPKDTAQTKAHGEWGRVELTTLTREFFMPRFLERDEAVRRAPCAQYPWDGVGEVRPFGAMEKTIVEGVY